MGCLARRALEADSAHAPSERVETGTCLGEPPNLWNHKRPGSLLNRPSVLEDGLGLADKEMKWALGPHRRFVFQSPKGWRRQPIEPTRRFLDFQSHDEAGLVFRATNLFKPADGSGEPSLRAMPPLTVEYSFTPSETEWSVHRWTLLFSDFETQMMGFLELYYLPERARESEEWAERIKQSAPKSLFAPDTWNMTRGEQQ